MKYKLLIVALSIILLWTFYNKHQHKSHKEDIVVKSTGRFQTTLQSIDAGSVYNDTIFEKAFYFKNIGIEPLRIEEFKTSCTCTAASFNDSIISPGDTAIFNMQVDTHGKFPGNQGIDGVIKTNGEKTFYRLKLSFSIKERMP